MGLAQIMLIFVHLMFASALPGTLYVGSVLLGLCFGVHFSIMVPTASELFGLKHFGMIYNFLTIANPLGSFLFSGLIAGYLYDREAAKDESGSGTLYKHTVCTGAHCFRLTFYVMACVCSVGVVLTFVLTYRIRRVYIALYKKSPHPSASDLE
jgi:MFS family permease